MNRNHIRIVDQSDVRPGDIADHRSRTLDPRPVARIEHGVDLYLDLRGTEIGPLDAADYTYIRINN